jgi:hypothetical protein
MYDKNLGEWECVECGKKFNVAVRCSYEWSSEVDVLHFFDEGFDARKRGTFIDECPYPHGSPEYQDWHEGYDHAEIAEVSE